MTIDEICDHLEIDRKTFYLWLDEKNTPDPVTGRPDQKNTGKPMIGITPESPKPGDNPPV